MATTDRVKPEQFFASRSGVCVYVTIQRRAFRIRFASMDAHGVVAEGQGDGADDALHLARTALHQHSATLAPLFEKVARRMT